MQIQDAHIKLIRETLPKISNKKDLLELFHIGEAMLFGMEKVDLQLKDLTFFANPNWSKNRYTQFTIKKKSGKQRTINAPVPRLKYILRVLNFILQAATTPHRAATGFVLGKSVVDNAKMHIGKRYVYNIDLKDFFHSFERQQVKRLFMQAPFNFKDEKEPLAFLLAGLVTHPFEINGQVKTVLPQGSPTSPTLTNLLSKKLDRRLTGLANRFGLTYTRYADDMTFSSNHNVYRKQEFLEELQRIITELGLEINPDKTRLQYQTYRQETTGLVVNEKVNVKRRYIKQIRHWLYFWERYGYEKAQELFLKNYKDDKGHVKKGKANLVNVLEGKLLYLKMVKGINDPTYNKLATRFNKLLLKSNGYDDLINNSTIVSKKKDSVLFFKTFKRLNPHILSDMKSIGVFNREEELNKYEKLSHYLNTRAYAQMLISSAKRLKKGAIKLKEQKVDDTKAKQKEQKPEDNNKEKVETKENVSTQENTPKHKPKVRKSLGSIVNKIVNSKGSNDLKIAYKELDEYVDTYEPSENEVNDAKKELTDYYQSNNLDFENISNANKLTIDELTEIFKESKTEEEFYTRAAALMEKHQARLKAAYELSGVDLKDSRDTYISDLNSEINNVFRDLSKMIGDKLEEDKRVAAREKMKKEIAEREKAEKERKEREKEIQKKKQKEAQEKRKVKTTEVNPITSDLDAVESVDFDTQDMLDKIKGVGANLRGFLRLLYSSTAFGVSLEEVYNNYLRNAGIRFESVITNKNRLDIIGAEIGNLKPFLNILGKSVSENIQGRITSISFRGSHIRVNYKTVENNHRHIDIPMDEVNPILQTFARNFIPENRKELDANNVKPDTKIDFSFNLDYMFSPGNLLTYYNLDKLNKKDYEAINSIYKRYKEFFERVAQKHNYDPESAANEIIQLQKSMRTELMSIYGKAIIIETTGEFMTRNFGEDYMKLIGTEDGYKTLVSNENFVKYAAIKSKTKQTEFEGGIPYPSWYNPVNVGLSALFRGRSIENYRKHAAEARQQIAENNTMRSTIQESNTGKYFTSNDEYYRVTQLINDDDLLKALRERRLVIARLEGDIDGGTFGFTTRTVGIQMMDNIGRAVKIQDASNFESFRKELKKVLGDRKSVQHIRVLLIPEGANTFSVSILGSSDGRLQERYKKMNENFELLLKKAEQDPKYGKKLARLLKKKFIHEDYGKVTNSNYMSIIMDIIYKAFPYKEEGSDRYQFRDTHELFNKFSEVLDMYEYSPDTPIEKLKFKEFKVYYLDNVATYILPVQLVRENGDKVYTSVKQRSIILKKPRPTPIATQDISKDDIRVKKILARINSRSYEKAYVSLINLEKEIGDLPDFLQKEKDILENKFKYQYHPIIGKIVEDLEMKPATNSIKIDVNETNKGSEDRVSVIYDEIEPRYSRRGRLERLGKYKILTNIPSEVVKDIQEMIERRASIEEIKDFIANSDKNIKLSEESEKDIDDLFNSLKKDNEENCE